MLLALDPHLTWLEASVRVGAAAGLGGLIGVAGGLASALVIGLFGTAVKISTGPILLAFGCAFLTGLVFGYLPARKAAALDPVVALASE